jgi:AcrR family transcriptional regulator
MIPAWLLIKELVNNHAAVAAKRKRRSVGRPNLGTADDARESLLDAAVNLFAKKGVAGTKVVEIAAAANVTGAMVHYYFRKRDQLVDAVVAERLGPIVIQIWCPVTETAEVESLLTGFAARVMAAAERYPWLASLWLREVVSEGGLLRARLLQLLPAARVQQLINAVSAAQRTSRLSHDLDPRLVVASILGLTMLPMAALPVFQELPTVRGINPRHIARHANAVLRGLLHEPPAIKRRAAT